MLSLNVKSFPVKMKKCQQGISGFSTSHQVSQYLPPKEQHSHSRETGSKSGAKTLLRGFELLPTDKSKVYGS